MKNAILLSGSASTHIAKKIKESFQINYSEVKVQTFSDGEIFVKINESIRGRDIFYIQSTSAPANNNLMELLLTLDAIKRSSPRTVTVIIPYFGYSRQDRKTESRVPISARLVADMIQTAGVDRVVTLDIHADQIQGFFNVPVDNLYGANIFLEYIKNKSLDNTIIASPDAGGVSRARYFAKRLNINDLAIIDKRREKANESEVMNVLGDVDGKHVIIVDDMVDTAGTLIKAAKAFKDSGARSVKACITHGVLSGPALERIETGVLDELIITDSIPLLKPGNKITILNSSPLIGEAIYRLSIDRSISQLWN